MAHSWQFTQDEQQQWHWTRVDDDKSATRSPVAFATELDCYLDAVRQAVRARRPDTAGSEDSQTH